MRSGLSSLAAVLALATGVPAFAQTNITMSATLVETALPNDDFEKNVKPQDVTPKVRPNSPNAGVYFVYAKNTHPTQDRTLVVEMRGAKDEPIAEGRAEKVPAGSWKVVRFAKPAAPPAPAPVPAPTANAPAAAPVEPPPPGVPVARSADGFRLKLKVFEVDDAKGTKTEAGNNKQDVVITFQSPTDYVTVNSLQKGEKDSATIELSLKNDKTPGKIPVRISFPGQPNGAPPAGVIGLFSSTLDSAVDGSKKVKLGGVFKNDLVPMHVSVDGVDRVAVYGAGKSADTNGVVTPDKGAAVRVIPVTGANATQPTAAYAVRVETDNADPTDTLELRVHPKGGDAATVDVIPLGGPRDEKLWMDVAEPTKQGLGFATRTTDWVKSFDLTTARGEVEVEAVLKKGPTSGSLTVKVDADPPAIGGSVVVGDPEKPKERVLKGDILPLRATVTDAVSGVKKVSFVMFSKLQEDGTFPPDAIKADGVQLKEIDRKTGKPTGNMSNEWAAELLPPEKAGRYQIAVVAADNAGNVNKIEKGDTSLKVVLVDLTGATVRGAISGVVYFGGRPQPGLYVAVGGPDGKAKAVALTNEHGKFCIDNLLPGSYTLTTMKTDSNKGFSGAADVTVEPEKTAKVTIELIRNKDGR